jgi:hypothetical protein
MKGTFSKEHDDKSRRLSNRMGLGCGSAMGSDSKPMVFGKVIQLFEVPIDIQYRILLLPS